MERNITWGESLPVLPMDPLPTPAPLLQDSRRLAQDVPGALEALLAKGVAHWTAIGTIAHTAGPEAVRPLWERHRETLNLEGVLYLLDQVAEGSPTTAERWLFEYLDRLEGRIVRGFLNLFNRAWVETLPKGLAVGGTLNLKGTAMTHLPERLRVGGNLDLSKLSIRVLPDGLLVGDCLLARGTQLEALPPGLKIGGDLYLRGCTTWLGTIPPDAVVRGMVCTDRHPDGLPLARWRDLHPEGERFIRQPQSTHALALANASGGGAP
jgi:hypothetical protein